MSVMKKERTPEQVEAAKARMAAVRAKKGEKPYGVSPLISSGILEEMKKDNVAAALPAIAKAGYEAGRAEHKSAIQTDELEGISAKDCCDSCYASKGEKCAITHAPLCGHPLKSGLQSRDMLKPDVVARYQKAKKILAHAKIEAT